MDDQFDFVIIGAGPAGEAATYLARAQGASVSVVDRELFGGSCPFWACMTGDRSALPDSPYCHVPATFDPFARR